MRNVIPKVLVLAALVLGCGEDDGGVEPSTPGPTGLGAAPAGPVMHKAVRQMQQSLDWDGGWTPQGRWGAEGDLGGETAPPYKGNWPCPICENGVLDMLPVRPQDEVPIMPQWELPPSVLPPPDPMILYLSADDSNSQASPTAARSEILNGRLVNASDVRIWEFLNYYGFEYAPPAGQALTVTQQLRPYAYDEGIYALQIGIQGRVVDSTRRPLNITFSIDTSGSMGGHPIKMAKEVCWTVAGKLRDGDRVSMVNWSTSQSVLLDSLEVSGPWDADLLAACGGLSTGGGTDLHSGLVAAYDLAEANFIEDGMNRVVLISDGGANVGITDENLIAGHAEVAEGEAIYLVGVGVAKHASSYNDTLMDVVTDLGRGAYVFIDSQDEARRAFGERFLANLEIIARDVQVELTLPPFFDMHEYFGEEYSQDAEEVEPQHLAPNDAMIYQQLISTTQPEAVAADDEITARVTYIDALTGEEGEVGSTASMQQLVDGACDQLRKGDAVVVYAQALGQVKALVNDGEHALATMECLGALAIVQEAYAELGDEDLADIVDLLDAYCELVPN